MNWCWADEPEKRPTFKQVIDDLGLAMKVSFVMFYQIFSINCLVQNVMCFLKLYGRYFVKNIVGRF